MSSMVRTSLSLAFVAGVFLSAGCGDTIPASGEMVEVKGTVTLADGKPLKAGMIHFKPDGSGGRDDLGVIKDGAFTTKMYVGKYKVAIDVDNTRPGVPAKFTKYDSSGLTAEVKGGMQPLTIEVK